MNENIKEVGYWQHLQLFGVGLSSELKITDETN
jgi:hypothetical protein